jgi:hypothetical protein
MHSHVSLFCPAQKVSLSIQGKNWRRILKCFVEVCVKYIYSATIWSLQSLRLNTRYL